VKTAVIVVVLCACSTIVSAQEWHPVASPFCSQIKAKGAKVSGRPFSVFVAPTEDSNCCEHLSLKMKGKTERFGYFKLASLDRGRYFVLFDLKTKQVVVPLTVDRVLNFKDCEPMSRITVEKGTDHLKWDEWITVD
jgi:hypothetical protein